MLLFFLNHLYICKVTYSRFRSFVRVHISRLQIQQNRNFTTNHELPNPSQLGEVVTRNNHIGLAIQMSILDRAHFTACLQPIPNTREALLSPIHPFLHQTQKKFWHRVPPSLHRYYNIYKVPFVQIFQFVQIQPYNILFICQMPLTTTSTIQFPNHRRHRLSDSYRKLCGPTLGLWIGVGRYQHLPTETNRW